MILYHVTSKQNLPSIRQHGLSPMLGPNSSMCEDFPVICFSDDKSLGHWIILLSIEDPIILKFDTDHSSTDLTDQDICRYNEFIEYRYYHSIPYTDLIETQLHLQECEYKQIMRNICKTYIFDISRITVKCAEYYQEAEHSKEDVTNMKTLLQNTLTIIKRLNYSFLTDDEIKEKLIDLGQSGEYTFCDTYQYTDQRLWNLTMYPNDSLTELREKLENWFKDTFKNCLTVNTGGWSN